MCRHTLLLVDDDALWLQTATRCLQERKYKIITAGNRQEGVAAALEHKPDAILLDFHLKDENCRAFIGKLRETTRLLKTPIIMVSGDIGQEIPAYEDYGLDGFFYKTESMDKLAGMLVSLLRRIELERGIMVNNDLRLEEAGLMVYFESKPLLRLSADRFSLLSLLVGQSPQFVGESTIVRRLYNSEFTQEKAASVKMLVSRLRQDLGPLSERIRNKRGCGWAYLPPCAEETVS